MPFYRIAAIQLLAGGMLLAQSVIATHSGVVHFFEGAVYLNDQQLQPHLGSFPTIPQGGELRTAEGRAEVLLTPGVFLRMDAQSSIRMASNDLADTQVELLTGSVIVESGVPNADTSVTLNYQSWGIHFTREGVYRVGADPPQLWVRQGAAEVAAADDGSAVSVDAGMTLPLAKVLVPEQSTSEPNDALRNWQAGRSESISADNAITAQIDEDPGSQAAGAYGFTDFPMLGVLPPGTGLSGLNNDAALCNAGLCQPGFSSIYLPGYAYRPLILGPIGRGLVGRGPFTFVPRYPVPTAGRGLIGLTPHPPGGLTVAPLPRPGVPRPLVLSPPPVRSLPRMGGGRR